LAKLADVYDVSMNRFLHPKKSLSVGLQAVFAEIQIVGWLNRYLTRITVEFEKDRTTITDAKNT